MTLGNTDTLHSPVFCFIAPRSLWLLSGLVAVEKLYPLALRRDKERGVRMRKKLLDDYFSPRYKSCCCSCCWCGFLWPYMAVWGMERRLYSPDQATDDSSSNAHWNVFLPSFPPRRELHPHSEMIEMNTSPSTRVNSDVMKTTDTILEGRETPCL